MVYSTHHAGEIGVPKIQKVYRYGYHVKNLRHILKHGVESTFGVEPLSGVVFGVEFLDRRFGVTIADSDQENIWKSNQASPFRAKGHVLISALVWPDPTL